MHDQKPPGRGAGRLGELLRAALMVAVLCAFAARPACAGLVEAGEAEALYQAGKYREALDAFKALAEHFRDLQKDSSDYRVYREAAYLYDRMADCSFTTRDWEALKSNLDGLLVVGVSERNLTQTQFAGAMDSGIASATARYLATRVDEAVRLNSLFQLKRSAGLVLYENHGEGQAGTDAIKQYQKLAALTQEVLTRLNGEYSLDIDALDERISDFDAVYEALQQITDMEALWQKYPPESGKEAGGAQP
jgi:hypothetical protein